MAEPAKRDESHDADMKELREEYQYARDEKAEIREEGARDMRVISGDVWGAMDPDGKTARDEAQRPILSLDEAGQYVNQLVNSIRQNKRGIVVAPQGRGATKGTADFRQNLIRQGEYRSNAQQAYAVMAENAFQRSYGYLRVVPDYVSHDSFDQELRIKAVPNPDMVTEDPADGRTDGADWKFLYFNEQWTRARFRSTFKNAQIISFDQASVIGATDWFSANSVMVAERWRIVGKPRKLLLVQPAALEQAMGRAAVQPMPYTAFEDELEKKPLPPGARVIRDRAVDYPSVKKQIVSGVEVLEERDFPGTSIPFVSCYGKVIYLDEGAGPKKKILSLIRLARDPMMLYCYYRTQQAEMAGMIPKVPVSGYKGQFESHEDDWQKAPHEPLAYIQSNFTTDGWNPNWGPMPLPQRIAYSAGEHLQALELCAEGARRAIQAAVGTSPLPTQAQRRNEKSGVALKTIEDAEQRGSFHFIDHFDDALLRTGQIFCDLIPFYYDTKRDVTVRDEQDQPSVVSINDPGNPEAVNAVDGDHDVTISVGPWEASERETASNFADSLLNSVLLKLMPPPMALKLAALATRLKSVGPIGDEIAEMLSPKQEEGEQQGPTPDQVQQMQQQLQALGAKLQEAEQALQTDKIKVDGQIYIKELDLKFQREKLQQESETKITVAELSAKVDRIALFLEERARLGLQGHEAGLAAMGAVHQQQAAAQGHAQQLEAGAVSHGQQLEASDIDAQRAQEQAAIEAQQGGGA